jgi:hypothetical protein
MARINNDSVVSAISIENTTVGEYLDDGALFRKIMGNSQNTLVPSRENIPDEMVGDGNYNPQQGKPSYYDPQAIPYAGLLHSTTSERLLRVWNGGVATPTENTTEGTFDYDIVQLEPGEPPMTINWIDLEGGAKWLFGDVFVQTFSIQQSGSAEPTFSAELSNGGHFAEIADTNIDVADIEDADSYKRFDGKRTTVSFVIGATTYNLVTEKRLIDLSVQGNQNVQVEQMIGDLPIDAANPCEGGYTQNIFIGRRTLGSVSVNLKAYLKDTFPEFTSWKPNTKVTSLTIVFSTCETIGATTHHEEIEIKIPVAQFNLRGDTNGDFRAYNIEFQAIDGDPVSKSLVLTRIRRVGDLDEVIP